MTTENRGGQEGKKIEYINYTESSEEGHSVSGPLSNSEGIAILLDRSVMSL